LFRSAHLRPPGRAGIPPTAVPCQRMSDGRHPRRSTAMSCSASLSLPLSHNSVRWLLSAALACVLPFPVSSSEPVLQDFVFISDTQHPWTEKSDSGEPESNDEKVRRSKLFINRQALATMEYRMEFGGLDNVPLFLNGDITAFGHGGERDYMYDHPFKDFYRRNFYANLGNHDYQNNVNDCANNGCAR